MLMDWIRRMLHELYPRYIDDPNFVDTPRRFERVLEDFFWSEERVERAIDELFKAVFPSRLDEIVMVKDVEVWMLCPHHLLPVRMEVAIGYLPNGRVLGLSKLPRLARLLARRPRLQEEYTELLVEILMEKLNPRGAMAIVKGEHTCVRMRGVRMSDAVMVTSAVRGDFKENPSLKQEFLELMCS